MDYKPEGVYYESDISRSMSDRMINHDQSMTNRTTCNRRPNRVGWYNRYQGTDKGDQS